MFLRSGEVLLRPLSYKDTEFLLLARNDPEMSSEFFSDSPIYDFEHDQWLRTKAKDNIELIIEYQNQSVGQVRITDIDFRNQKAQFGIFVIKQFQKKGIATTASRLLINYVFENLPINKIYLELFDYNKAAEKLYEKLGFFKEGIFREEVYKNGKFRNVIRMSILKSEWSKLKGINV